MTISAMLVLNLILFAIEMALIGRILMVGTRLSVRKIIVEYTWATSGSGFNPGVLLALVVWLFSGIGHAPTPDQQFVSILDVFLPYLIPGLWGLSACLMIVGILKTLLLMRKSPRFNPAP